MKLLGMVSLKQVGLWALTLILSGCTLLAEEPETKEPDATVETESVVEVEFMESAPTDRFVIRNMGSCVLEELTLELDLSPSAGMLIFDTSATGAGVEVFQPFEVEEGDIVQLAGEGVSDGDAELTLRIADLGPGERASFTIDVDDTLPRSELGQIRVADSEISGAIVGISAGDAEATFTKFDGSIARANLPTCPPA